MSVIKKSPFKLNSFTVVNFSIERQPLKQTEGNIDITPSGVVNRKKGIFTLILNVEVKDKNESFKLDMVCVGVFKFKLNIETQEMSNYFLTNAPAIVFPYIRSYISAVTALSGLEAVNLPVMNLSPLKRVLSDNIKEVEE